MKTKTLIRTLLLTVSLSISATGFAWHTYYHGGYYHGGGGYYHGGGGYYHGWGYGGPRVIVTPPYGGGYYAPGYRPRCSYIQQCYPNGNCIQQRICR